MISAVLIEDATGREHSLIRLFQENDNEVSIGRAESKLDCTIKLGEGIPSEEFRDNGVSTVSRYHGVITNRDKLDPLGVFGEGHYLKNHSATNKIKITSPFGNESNLDWTDEVVLGDGDILSFGTYRVFYKLKE